MSQNDATGAAPARRTALNPSGKPLVRGRESTEQEAAAEFGGEDDRQVPGRRVARGGYAGRPPE